MDWGNRLFWGFMVWVTINLLWLRFLEPVASMWVGCAVGIVGLVVTMVVLKRLYPFDAAPVGDR
ncbi:hypothetical protein [Geminicoccus flavidas]|uniref:hypothetical protein n=1 Tax=Geminicoccus flavidas TaxID=2506407 RepID=UPI00135798CD|nr:hypothetical protein [Geminicoccus flavidas]